MPNIIKVFPKTSLTVIGRSPSDSKLRKLITDLSLEDKIAFRSGITEEEIVNLYHSSEIAVIPSLYEGFGFGAGEAMACGIPLISTHSGGLEEVVGDSAEKILPASTEEIESAVIKLFSSPDRKTELSKMGRERMEKMFDWHIAAKSYENAFKEVIRIFKNEHHKI